MKSATPKVLHEIAGRSMLAHVLLAVKEAGASDVAVVIGPGRDDAVAEMNRTLPSALVFIQNDRLGTAHAVLSARTLLQHAPDDVIIAYADTPLVTAATFARLRESLAKGAPIAVLGFEAADPTGYGRLVREEGRLVAIREERDASPEERAIRLSNAGLMAFDGRSVLALLEAIGNGNAKCEYYLTDVVEIAAVRGLEARIVLAPEAEVQGVNDRRQLADAEATCQSRLRERAMLAGVTLIAPETVVLCADTEIGRDVTIEPNVVFGPGVTLGDGVRVRAFSHLEGAQVGPGAVVGPFARLRPGSRIGEGAHIGNFVEVKNATIGAGAKANHLSYLGDASIGAGVNIGAGTITCNYDGYGKHRTSIGEGAFIGVHAALIAPVSIGAGAYVATGSVITENVPADALALARSRQVVKEGRAVELRSRLKAAKAGREPC